MLRDATGAMHILVGRRRRAQLQMQDIGGALPPPSPNGPGEDASALTLPVRLQQAEAMLGQVVAVSQEGLASCKVRGQGRVWK